jgi:Ca-activated chloride channel family protein
MTFGAPAMLVLLLLVPLLLGAYLWALRRRQRYAMRYASLSLLRQAVDRGPGRRRHIPPALFLLSLAAMTFSLAQPKATLALPTQEGVVILTIDVSGSMAATDLEPTRLEVAKEAAKAFVLRQPSSVRIGVVTFSDNAFLVQQPTQIRETINSAIDDLQPQSGTAIGLGMLAALDAIDRDLTTAGAESTSSNDQTRLVPTEFAPALVVLLSDGESNRGPNPRDVAAAAADRGVRVHTIGLGSPEGAIVRVMGRAARVGIDEETLQFIADTTQGKYYKAATERELIEVYESLDTRLVVKSEPRDIAPFAVAFAVVSSVLGGILSLIWFNRIA